MIMDGQRMTTLIDSGAQVSSISYQFCEDLALQIQPLGQLLELEGTGDSAIPYLGFMEVNLQILGIKNDHEDVLLLVIPTMTYSEMVLVMVGSTIIDRAMRIITRGELIKVTRTWRQAHFGAVMSGSLQPPHMGSNGTGVEDEAIHSSLRDDTMEVKEFCLDDVRGPVHTTQKVTIPSIQHNKCECQYQCQKTLYAGPHAHRTNATSPVAYSSGADCDLWRTTFGSLSVPICLCNLGTHSIEIPTKIVVGQVVAVN